MGMVVKFAQLTHLYQRHQSEYEEAALRALRSGWYILGRELAEFEAHFARANGVAHCVGLNSGLDALKFALVALGVQAGDEVIVPTNTFIATALAVSDCGAVPVFVDADPYYGMDPSRVEEAITPKTKALIAVHLYGQMCDMDALLSVARKRGLFVVEDCAQSHFADQGGRLAGTVGDIGCFSFYPMKPLGAFGDAGAVITQRAELAEKIAMLRNYGSNVKYYHEIYGANSRMDELQAALLLVNLRYAKDGNRERCEIANRYRSGIQNRAVSLPDQREGATHVWHVFAVRCKERDALQKYLEEQGVQTQIHYPVPCHLAECYRHLGYTAGQFPRSEQYAGELLSLPIYAGMPSEEIDHVIQAVNRFAPAAAARL